MNSLEVDYEKSLVNLPWRVAKDTATLVLVSKVALNIFRRAWEASYDTLCSANIL